MEDKPDFMQLFNRNLDLNKKVYRYLTFDKFRSLVERKEIYLRRVDLYPDELEGELPMHIAEKLDRNFPLPKGEKLSVLYPIGKKFIFASCWNLDEKESLSMWKRYSNLQEGIVIQTTINKLLSSVPDDDRLFYGGVKYIDEEDFINPGNFISAFMNKRRVYADEKEFRIGLFVLNEYGSWFADVKEKGKFIKSDVNLLIDNIIVAPNATDDFFELVSNLSKKSLAKSKITKSNIEL